MGVKNERHAAILLATVAALSGCLLLRTLFRGNFNPNVAALMLCVAVMGISAVWLSRGSPQRRRIPWVLGIVTLFMVQLEVRVLVALWSNLRYMGPLVDGGLWWHLIEQLLWLAVTMGAVCAWWLTRHLRQSTDRAPPLFNVHGGRNLVGGLGLLFLLGAFALLFILKDAARSEALGTWFVLFGACVVPGIILLSVRAGRERGAPAWQGQTAAQLFGNLAVVQTGELPALDPVSVGMPSPETLATGSDDPEAGNGLLLGSIRLGDSFELVEAYVRARNTALGPAWARHVDALLTRPMPADATLRPGEIVADVFTDRDEQESGDTVIRSLTPNRQALERLYSAVFTATFPQYMAAMKRRDAIAKDHRLAEIVDQVDIAKGALADPVNYTADASGYMHHIRRRTQDRCYLDASVPAVLPLLDEAPHAYVTGGTGSGKSELLKNIALEYALRDDAAVVLIDPHGTLAAALARREEFAPGGPLADRLVYVDPTLGDGRLMPTINPLETADRSPRAVQVLSEQMTGAFEEVLGARQGSALTVNMVNLLGESLRALMTLGGRDLGDLRRLLVDNPALIAACQQVSDDPDVDYFGVEFHKDQLQPAKESLQGKLKAMLAGNRMLFVGKSTVDLEALTAQRKVIIFNLSKGQIGPLSSEAFGRFVVAQLCSMALRQESTPLAQRTRVRLLIDECHHYIGPSITTILAETRKYELRLILCQQYAGQGMSAEFRQAVLAHTSKKICGRNEDAATLRLMAETMQMDVEALQAIPQYAFAVKWGARRPFVMRARADRVDAIGDMSTDDWAIVKANQLAHYYRPVDATQRVDPRSIIPPPSSSQPVAEELEGPPPL